MVAAAVVGSAVVGGAASMSASSKASKAAKSTAAANNALQRETYDQNKATLAPYVAGGNRAQTQIQALLGLGGAADWSAYVHGNPDALAQWQNDPAERAKWGGDIYRFGEFHYNNDGARRDLTPYQSSQTAALNNFRNSAGYQDQFAEGQRAVTSALGDRGLLDSGAAQKALVKYGQSQANQSLQQYLQNLVQQQGAGLGAASAQAGVGSNYANAVSANNNMAAQTSANAALSSAGAINGVLQSGVSAYGFSQGMGSSYTPYGGPVGANTNAYGVQGGNIY